MSKLRSRSWCSTATPMSCTPTSSATTTSCQCCRHPATTTSSDRYPTLYALDGPFTFGLVAHGSLLLTFDDIIPEMIVVSIGKPLASMYEWARPVAATTHLCRCPTRAAGHADAFADSLVNEIIPFVEKQYRTLPDDRTLWGQSLGGVFALHLLFQRPGIFQRYIATSPAVENEAVRLLDLSSLPPAGTSVPARLFTCVGSDDVEYREGIEQFQAELVGRHYQDLRYEHVSYPGMHHIATGASGFIAGFNLYSRRERRASPAAQCDEQGIQATGRRRARTIWGRL